MGRLSEKFKDWCFWGEAWDSTWTEPKRRKEVLEILKTRLKERGLSNLADRIDALVWRYPYDITLEIGGHRASVKLESPSTLPEDMVRLEMELKRDKSFPPVGYAPGEIYLDITIGKPTGDSVLIHDENRYVRKHVLAPDTELLVELSRPRVKQRVEEAMICFLYDIFGERMLTEWAIKDEVELWQIIKEECGERLYKTP